MSVNLSTFEQILDKYKFRQPVSGSVQEYILANRGKILTDTLRNLNQYSFFYGRVISVYFFLKKIGLGVSILVSKIITAAIMFIACASIVLGLFTAVRYFILSHGQETTASLASISLRGAPEDTVDTSPASHQPVVTHYILGVDHFSSLSFDKRTLKQAEDIVIGELRRLEGNSVADIRHDRAKKSIDYLLSGAIETLGRQKIFTVKVISVENSKIVFVAEETIDDNTDLTKACVSLAEKISQKI